MICECENNEFWDQEYYYAHHPLKEKSWIFEVRLKSWAPQKIEDMKIL